ncbi:MAG: DUF1800 domain-containing protein [Roseateles sp.]|uniref:DUF1800 domain-containing protein n=1 Tax=Roseateles sp. TaxID=1971397 RepID=UPI0039ED47F4
MRTLALAAVLAAVLAGCATAPAADPATQPAAQTTAQTARDALWLDRLTWGATGADLAQLRRQGRAAWLDAQLDDGPAARPPALPPLPPLLPLVQQLAAQRQAADALADGDARAAARRAYQQALARLARGASARTLLHALDSPQQLREQLTWFWFNHFNVAQAKGDLRAMVGDYEQGLRERALGRFRDLLGYAVRHPALLRYLDNERNAARRLNENHARELLELHTLGVDGGYGQRDVQALARVLTGLGLRLADGPPRLRPAQQARYWRDGLAEFNPARHDFGAKTLLGQPIRGDGLAEIDHVLDLLARHPATARHLCAKLARYFVADEPPPALVARMAERWRRSDGRIAEVLRTLVASPEFEASLGRKFKDPVHYVVSAVRLAHADRAALDTAPLLGWLNRLGQAPHDRATPDGYPLDEGAWAGPGQMATRFEVAQAIGSGMPALRRAPGQRRPAVPQLDTPLYRDAIAPRLAPATRAALAGAASPQAWNTLLLASPEFMHR